MCYHLKRSNSYVILLSRYNSGRSHRRCSIKKLLSKISQYSQEKKLFLVFFREYCEFFQNPYFEKHLQTAAFETHLITKLFIKILLCKNMLSEII